MAKKSCKRACTSSREPNFCPPPRCGALKVQDLVEEITREKEAIVAIHLIVRGHER